MNITIIHGQNHKGSSYHIGRILAEKLADENEITEFFLPRDLNHFCIGCYKCIDDESKCPFYGEKKAIMDAVEKAELLIFTTPCYCMRTSAPMKAFIDLTFTYWMSHRPRAIMFKKKAVVISTAAGSGAKTATKDISTMLSYWGVPYVKSYGICVQAMNWESVRAGKKNKIERDISKLAKKLKKVETPKVGIKIKMTFRMMRMMQKAGMGSGENEKQYWQEQGWLKGKRPWKDTN